MDTHGAGLGFREHSAENDTSEGVSIDRDTLGQYLRKIRISSRIEVHKMAADTRLSAEYIAAIEKDEFNKIPGHTYQKIFIKSVAKYLGLNPEEIYARFQRQQGASEEIAAEPEPKLEKKETREIEKAEIAQHQKPVRHLAIIVGLLLLVFLLLVLAQKEKQAPADATSIGADSLAADTLAPSPSATLPSNQPEPLSNQPENTAYEPPAEPQEPVPEQPVTAEPAIQQNRFRNEKHGAIKVTVTCIQDSVYINAWRNKAIWFNIFRTGDKKTFASDNPLYFWVRQTGKITIEVNNTTMPFDISKGRYLKIDAAGLAYVPQAEWEENTGIKR